MCYLFWGMVKIYHSLIDGGKGVCRVDCMVDCMTVIMYRIVKERCVIIMFAGWSEFI